ncbi:MAG TPA: Holliday junction resolvase RuvX [Bacteroidales bacterium]|nr:Holliday junction resolvase RuvX [Bacteroidales bacterium]
MLDRIMAIDFGTKRVGLAVTDPMRIVASGLKTISTHRIFEFLAAYFSKENVSEIVVGYPKKLNNQPSESVKYINPFVRKLEQLYPEKKISLMDERFTSKIAFQSMIDGGLKKRQRQNKELIDQISAVLILQGYLEYRKVYK